MTPEELARVLTWSYGGGTQSAAIAVLVARGILPRPEMTVIADTGREQTETWTYLQNHVQPLLDTVGVRVERAHHDGASVDLYSNRGMLVIPAYTKPAGKFPTYCSTEWKKRVVSRFLRAYGYGPSKPVETWIGFSAEEERRKKDNDLQWQKYTWPLIDMVPLTREQCRQVVLDAGLPQPLRSSCWMCPYHTNAEWRHIRDTAPADWAKAVELDKLIRLRDDVYVHNSRKPLDEAPLGDEQMEIDTEGCDSGHCFV